MSGFSKVLATAARTPAGHVVLTPSCFADEWQEKPKEDIALGFRRLSDADVQTARAEAARFAISMHDDQEGQIEAFNDALLRWAIVRGTCDANDTTIPCSLWDGSEENVRLALSPQAIRFVWDEMERFHIETSPLVSQATDEDLAELATRITDDPDRLLTTGASKRLRKLLAFCLRELREADPTPPEETDEPLTIEG